MAPIFAIIRYALLETFFCIPILPKTDEHWKRMNRYLVNPYLILLYLFYLYLIALDLPA